MRPHVDVEINAGIPAKAKLLQVVPIPWPGLIGNEGVLRSAGPIDAEALDRVLRAYLDYYKIPGMSVAVIKDFEGCLSPRARCQEHADPGASD